MPKETNKVVLNRLSLNRFPLSITKDDLRRLCDILQGNLNEAVNLEIQNLNRGQLSNQEYEKSKDTIRDGYILRLTVRSLNGPELYGTVDEIFNSRNFPDEITDVYINSQTVLKVLNFTPRNSFEILLDFTRPEIFKFTVQPSEPTHNVSQLSVQGYDTSWVNGLYHELQSFINSREASLDFLHRHSVYDYLLWPLGIPIGFWVCFRLSPMIQTFQLKTSTFLSAALYVYIFFIVLNIFRALFAYFRWVFPLVEYKHEKNRAMAHRAFLSTLSIGLLIALVVDVLRILFSN